MNCLVVSSVQWYLHIVIQKIILIQNFVGYNLYVDKVVKITQFLHLSIMKILGQLIYPGEPCTIVSKIFMWDTANIYFTNIKFLIF